MAAKPETGILRIIKKTKGYTMMCESEGSAVEVRLPAMGTAKRCAYNITYLTELLDRLVGKVKLLTTDKEPGLVKQGATTHVLMPMSVEWGDEKPKPPVPEQTPAAEAPEPAPAAV